MLPPAQHLALASLTQSRTDKTIGSDENCCPGGTGADAVFHDFSIGWKPVNMEAH